MDELRNGAGKSLFDCQQQRRRTNIFTFGRPHMARTNAAHGPGAVRPHQDLVRPNDDFFPTQIEAQYDRRLSNRIGAGLFSNATWEGVRLRDVLMAAGVHDNAYEIKLSGADPSRIAVVFTGLRPGEKLYEEPLAIEEATKPTPHPKLHIAQAREADAFAVGQMVTWCESDRTADLKDLKNEMKAVEKEGKEAYAKEKERIEAKQRESEAKLKALNEQRKAGTLSQTDYEAQVAALAG